MRKYQSILVTIATLCHLCLCEHSMRGEGDTLWHTAEQHAHSILYYRQTGWISLSITVMLLDVISRAFDFHCMRN